MLSFNPIVELKSATWPGVTFTIRRLSQVERAERDLAIAEHQFRVTELNERMRLIREPYEATEARPEPDKMPLDVQISIAKIDHEMGSLINAHLKPTTVKMGLVKVEGMDYGGQEPTAERLLKSGPDDLLDEIWVAVMQNMGLTYEQIKNLQSVTTSAEQEGGAVMPSTASSASAVATT